MQGNYRLLMLITLCTLSLLFGPLPDLEADFNDITLLTPAEGTCDIALSPGKILLRATDPIEVTTLKTESPYCSSTNGCIASIILLPQDVYLNSSTSVWNAFAIPGTLALVNATDIEFTLSTMFPLEHNKKYTILIRDLGIILPTFQVLLINKDISFAFKTIGLPPTVYRTSLDFDNSVSCDELLFINFSSPLQSLQTANGDMITMKKLTGRAWVDPLHTQSSSASVTIATVLDGAGTIATVINPMSYEPGEEYVLEINAGDITGSTDDNVKVHFLARDAAALSIDAQPADPMDVLPGDAMPYTGSGTVKLPVNETLALETPRFTADEQFYFKRWICPQDPAIDGLTSSTLALNFSCLELYDRSISAEYADMPVDIFQVSTSTMGVVFAYNYTADLGGGDYSLDWGDDKGMSFFAVPNPGYQFEHWKSNYPGLDNEQSEMINPSARPDWTTAVNKYWDLDPRFRPAATVNCDEWTICVEVKYHVGFFNENVQLDNLSNVFDENDITWTIVEPGRLRGCITLPNPPNPQNFNLDAFIIPHQSDCYTIGYWFDNFGNRGGTAYDQPAIGATLQYNYVLTSPAEKCSLHVNIFVEPIARFLTVEMCMQEGGEFEWRRYLDVVKADNFGRMLRPEYPKLTRNSEGNLTQVSYKYRYYCSEEAVHYPTAEAGSGYSTDEWICPDGQPENNDLWCSPEHPTPAAKTLRIAMDRDWRIRHKFKTDFRLMEIGFMDMENRGSFKMFKVEDFPSDYKEEADMYLAIPGLPAAQLAPPPGVWGDNNLHRTYTAIKFKFSHPVNEASLENGAIRVIDVEDVRDNRRYDGKRNTTYDYQIGFNGDLEFNGEVVELRLKDAESIYTSHMNKVKIFVTNAVQRASDNAPLANPITRGVRKATTFPGLYAWVDAAIMAREDEYDNCPGSGKPDVYIHGYAAAVETNAIQATEITRENSTLHWSTKSNMCFNDVYDNMDKEILRVNRLSRDPSLVAIMAFAFWDRGNADASGEWQKAIEGAKKTIKGVLPGNWNVSDGLVDGLADLVEIAIGCDDRQMGRRDFKYGFHNNLWGGRSLYGFTGSNYGHWFSRIGEMGVFYYWVLGDISN